MKIYLLGNFKTLLIDSKIGNENQLIAISKPISRAYLYSQTCIAGKAKWIE